ncbi:hypothetical protein KIPB_006092, partial [Kipferlia bialata]
GSALVEIDPAGAAVCIATAVNQETLY